MTRTPDEIKKGLECRLRSYKDVCDHQCDTCDLRIPAYSIFERYEDALALIQQLERDKTWAGETSDMLREENKRLEERAHQLNILNLGLLVEKAQLEAERDAALEEIKRIGDCMYCKHDDICTARFPNCFKCENTDCPCYTCQLHDNWQWRGVQKEE